MQIQISSLPVHVEAESVKLEATCWFIIRMRSDDKQRCRNGLLMLALDRSLFSRSPQPDGRTTKGGLIDFGLAHNARMDVSRGGG